MMNKIAIIASNGALFDAYKVFNIATSAAASGKEETGHTYFYIQKAPQGLF